MKTALLCIATGLGCILAVIFLGPIGIVGLVVVGAALSIVSIFKDHSVIDPHACAWACRSGYAPRQAGRYGKVYHKTLRRELRKGNKDAYLIAHQEALRAIS